MDLNGVTFNAEDIKFIEKAIEIRNKGYYLDGGQLTAVYNRVLGKNVNVTNCGSCIRGRITELEAALNHFKTKIKAQETLKDEQVDNSSPEENKPTVEAENKSVEEKKRVGRPKKN